MRLLLIVNPSASSVTPRTQVLIQRELGKAHDVELAETTRRGHATRLAEDAAHRGLDAAVVLGGDGTLNEAANGLAHTDTALIALPGGSTNVFARSIGLPDDPLEATMATVQALANRDPGDAGEPIGTSIGLGQANDRWFLFHAGIGFDAAVVEQVERNSDLKRYLSHPLFIYAALKTWFLHYDRKQPHFVAYAGDGQRIDDGYFGIALNTNPYTYLGSAPLNLSDRAGLDEALVLLTVQSLRFANLAKLIGQAFTRGGVTSGKGLSVLEDVRSLTIESERPFPWQLDGDFLGRTTRLELGWEPDVLRLLQP